MLEMDIVKMKPTVLNATMMVVTVVQELVLSTQNIVQNVYVMKEENQ